MNTVQHPEVSELRFQLSLSHHNYKPLNMNKTPYTRQLFFEDKNCVLNSYPVKFVNLEWNAENDLALSQGSAPDTPSYDRMY